MRVEKFKNAHPKTNEKTNKKDVVKIEDVKVQTQCEADVADSSASNSTSNSAGKGGEKDEKGEAGEQYEEYRHGHGDADEENEGVEAAIHKCAPDTENVTNEGTHEKTRQGKVTQNWLKNLFMW